MDKYFICLANSYKYGGRCIAGIEVTKSQNGWRELRDSNGFPLWIRPISNKTESGEIRNEDALMIDVFDIVRLEDVVSCPNNAQTENVYYKKMYVEAKKGNTTNTNQILERLSDSKHQYLFYNHGKAVKPSDFAQGDYSIVLLHVSDVEIYSTVQYTDYPRYRIKFVYRQHSYDIPITDPNYLHDLRNGTRKEGEKGEMFVVCSLGLKHEGWHQKLAVFLQEISDELQFNINILEPVWFDEYEEQLTRLLVQKEKIELEIKSLRALLLQQMEQRKINRLNTANYDISYIPSKTTMRFDSQSLKKENIELYEKYCKPNLKKASIIIKKKSN